MDYARHPGVKADPLNLPRHIAIIMDGNGRWAAQQRLSRTRGHQRGVEVARDIIFCCQETGIEVLTLFAFGLENWKRPTREVRNLFRIFFLALRKEVVKLHERNIRLRIIGDRTLFNPTLRRAITQAEQTTGRNTGMILNIAVNYSGRWDLLNAIQTLFKKLHSECSRGEAITEESVGGALALAGLPEPDLFIRTGGVQRISNFILWELAYTELFFTSVLWPDFSRAVLSAALSDYAARERRFGLTGEQLCEA